MKKKRRLQRSDMLWLAAVTLLVLLQFWWLPGDPGTPDDTYSSTIEGKRGFFQTLDRLSQAGLLPPVRRESTKLIPDETCTLVVLSPDRYPDQNEKADLTSFVLNGGTLVFAPNWVPPNNEPPDADIPELQIEINFRESLSSETATSTAPGSTGAPNANGTPDEQAEAEDPAAGGLPAEAATPPETWPPNQPPRKNQTEDTIIRNPLQQNPITPPAPQTPPTSIDDGDFRSHEIAEVQTESQLVPGSFPWRTQATLSDRGLRPNVLVKTTNGDLQAASWEYGNGLVVVSASSDVFSNRAMLDEAQAELAIRLIEHAHTHHESGYRYSSDPDSTPIVVSEYLNASDSYRGTGVLMSPTLRSGTLQLLTIALLAGWFGFHRFGPAKHDTSVQRRSLTESAAAVGNLHFRTSSGGEAVRNYLEYMKTQLQKMFGRSVHLTDTATIAARCGMTADDVEQRVRRATGLATNSSTSTSAAADAIRGLSEILNRLHGGR